MLSCPFDFCHRGRQQEIPPFDLDFPASRTIKQNLFFKKVSSLEFAVVAVQKWIRRACVYVTSSTNTCEIRLCSCGSCWLIPFAVWDYILSIVYASSPTLTNMKDTATFRTMYLLPTFHISNAKPWKDWAWVPKTVTTFSPWTELWSSHIYSQTYAKCHVRYEDQRPLGISQLEGQKDK